MTGKCTAVLLLLVSVLFAGPASAKTYRHWHGTKNQVHHHAQSQDLKRHSHRWGGHKRLGRQAYTSRREAARHRRAAMRAARAASRYGYRRSYSRNRAAVARGAGAGAGGGIASHYSLAGRPTANGERANPSGLTAAHKSLPFGSRVQVTNVRNGRSVVVRINDRGPFVAGRVIDLTPAGARVLGFSGLAPVKLAVLR